jgi:hypothetical protein
MFGQLPGAIRADIVRMGRALNKLARLRASHPGSQKAPHE